MDEFVSAEEKWKHRATEQQQTFYTLFGLREWNVISRLHEHPREIIKLKIAFAFYGRLYDHCDEDQRLGIDFVAKEFFTLRTCSSGMPFVSFNFTYISTWDGIKDGIVPLMRVKINRDVWFLDTKILYQSWDDYLARNKLADDLHICFPKDGSYNHGTGELVEVTYDKCGTFRIGTVIGESGSSIPSPSCLFFPLYQPAFELSFTYEARHVSIAMKNVPNNAGGSYTDLHSLATWFKIIAPMYGIDSNTESDTTTLTIENNKAQKAMTTFASFYESPFSVHGYFVAVRLMKIIVTRDRSKYNAQLVHEFTEMLKFVFNVTLASSQMDELLVVLTKQYSFSNLFKSRPSWANEEMHALPRQMSPSTVLDTIAKRKVIGSNSATAKIKLLIDDLNVIIRHNRVGSNVWMTMIRKADTWRGMNALTMAPMASQHVLEHLGNVWSVFQDDANSLRDTLKTRGKDLDACDHLDRFALDRLSDCFDKLDAVGTYDGRIQHEFMKFCIDFTKLIGDFDDLGNAYGFIIGKFISKLQFFRIDYRAKTNAEERSTRDELSEFIEWFRNPPYIAELRKEYTEMNEALKKGETIHLFYYKGMHVEGIKTHLLSSTYINLCEKPWLAKFAKTKKLMSFFDKERYTKMICDHLGTDQFPKGADLYKNETILLHSKNPKFVLCAPFTPLKLDAFQVAQDVGITGILITFEVF